MKKVALQVGQSLLSCTRRRAHAFGTPWNLPRWNSQNLGTTPILKKNTLGVKRPYSPGYSQSTSRNGAHNLIYVKTLFSEQFSERLSELVGRQNFSPNSRSFFFQIGVVPPRQKFRPGQVEIARNKAMQKSSDVLHFLDFFLTWHVSLVCDDGTKRERRG